MSNQDKPTIDTTLCFPFFLPLKSVKVHFCVFDMCITTDKSTDCSTDCPLNSNVSSLRTKGGQNPLRKVSPLLFLKAIAAFGWRPQKEASNVEKQNKCQGLPCKLRQLTRFVLHSYGLLRVSREYKYACQTATRMELSSEPLLFAKVIVCWLVPL